MKTSIDQAVDRFLCWKLPEAFDPDCGISFTRDHDHEHSAYGRGKYEPTGTNLLTAEQAKAMLEHVCEPLLTALQERDAEIERLRVQLAGCGVAALHNTEKSAYLRAIQGEYGWSKSYAEVCRAVDREIAQRKVLEQALEALNAVVSVEGAAYTSQQKRALVDAAITAIQEQLK